MEFTDTVGDNLDKIRGMLVGVAMGDALGAPIEFRHTSKGEYTGYLQFKTRWVQRGNVRKLAVAQLTDDTEMTITLMRSLVRNEGYDKEDVILSYIKWANTTWSMGKNTRALFKGIKSTGNRALKTYNGRIARFKKTNEFKNNQSNGCLMRATPLLLFPDSIEDDVTITNLHPVCIDSVTVYVKILRYLYAGKSPNYTLLHVEKYIETKELRRVYRDVRKGKKRDLTESKGWILHAMYLVFTVLELLQEEEEAYGFSDIIDWVIDEHRGSDTDTNAAIVGGVLGIHFGLKKMLTEDKTKYNFRKIIKRDLSKGPTPRPKKYGLSDFYKLTEAYAKLE